MRIILAGVVVTNVLPMLDRLPTLTRLSFSNLAFSLAVSGLASTTRKSPFPIPPVGTKNGGICSKQAKSLANHGKPAALHFNAGDGIDRDFHQGRGEPEKRDEPKTSPVFDFDLVRCGIQHDNAARDDGRKGKRAAFLKWNRLLLISHAKILLPECELSMKWG